MQNSLPPKYRILTTLDGSPTLELSSNGVTENMHNFHGALSETDYIYGEALRVGLEHGIPLKVLSVGLGVGYNELMTAGFALSHGQEFEIHSFEMDDFLRQEFSNWLQGDGNTGPLTKTYRSILELWACKYGLPPDRIQQSLKDLKIGPRLDVDSPPSLACTILFYDPFSTKTNPSFWSEERIFRFLQATMEPQCVFSTYAATGALRRALKRSGFTLKKRPGFGGKRESFLALRTPQT